MNMLAAGVWDAVVLLREMYSILCSHETFVAMGRVPPV